MKKVLLIVSIFGFSNGFLSSEDLVDDYSSIFIKIYASEELASSFLKDNKYDTNRYSPGKAFDQKDNTAWVVSTKNGGIGEYIYIGINIDYGLHYPKKSKLKIKNGLFSNKSLYYANNRIKKAKFEIYECDVLLGQDEIKLRNKPVLNMTMKLDFKDEMVEQQFDIVINKPKPQVKSESHQYYYFGKLIITDIYKGSKYNDTCMSEIDTDIIP